MSAYTYPDRYYRYSCEAAGGVMHRITYSDGTIRYRFVYNDEAETYAVCVYSEEVELLSYVLDA